MECMIRPTHSGDAEGIRRIIAALRETNAKDYSEAVIARVEQSLSPAAVSDLLVRRRVFVALDHGRVVGTASLDDRVLRTVFVDPGYPGRGIGRALLARVERAAMERGARSWPCLHPSQPSHSTQSLGSARWRTATTARSGPS